MQDTLTRALTARTHFKAGTSFKAWLFTIQRNIFYEQYRRETKEHAILQNLEHLPTLESAQNTPQITHDTIRELDELLWQIPDILREALILVGAQELSYEEAATICSVPSGTMKARVSRARSLLNTLKSETSK